MTDKVDLVIDGPNSLCLDINALKDIGFVFANNPRKWPSENYPVQWELDLAGVPDGWTIHQSKNSTGKYILDENENLRLSTQNNTYQSSYGAWAKAYKRLEIKGLSNDNHIYQLRDGNYPFLNGHSRIVCAVTPDEMIIEQIPKGDDDDISLKRKADLLIERFFEVTVEKYLPGFKDDISLYWGQDLEKIFSTIQAELDAKTPALNAELKKLITSGPLQIISLAKPLKNILLY